MTIDLKPCPFCGGPAEFERLGDRRQSCIVVCTMCGARHESGDEGEHNGKSWNQREESIEQLRSERDALLDDWSEIEAAVTEFLATNPHSLGVITEFVNRILAARNTATKRVLDSVKDEADRRTE